MLKYETKERGISMTIGIIAEYNPFHNGHAYQIAWARQLVNPDCVAVCMSGDFMQRGEPAVLDKWTRARIAAEQGIDLVLDAAGFDAAAAQVPVVIPGRKELR